MDCLLEPKRVAAVELAISGGSTVTEMLFIQYEY